ncbi:MAG: dephospho-CoA kinase [Puniceicoccales bacterium]|jgi:dephospho-CoA kinase|nr:dephospho-CoA kinase [Puniceicoccales bacterium]
MGTIRIGLTGGVCCGKSTAIKAFEAIGFDAIDLNNFIHEALQGNAKIRKGISTHFGENCYDSSGHLSIEKLVESLNTTTLGELDTLLSPHIEDLIKRDIPVPMVIEVPLLFEKHLASYFDFTICIYSSYPLQLMRAIFLKKWTKARLDSMIIKQFPLEEKIRYANYVIGNNGNVLQFYRQIQHFVRHSGLMGKLNSN